MKWTLSEGIKGDRGSKMGRGLTEGGVAQAAHQRWKARIGRYIEDTGGWDRIG